MYKLSVLKYLTTKDQYAFIHDAVLEWLICGDTKISAGEMKRAMERLAQRDIQTEENGYDTQFKVRKVHKVGCILYHKLLMA